MRIRRTSFVLSLAIALTVSSACSTQKYYWTHSYKDSQQYYADNSYCLAQSSGTRATGKLPEDQGGVSGAFASGWNTVAEAEAMEMQRTIHRQCMMGKGWRLTAE